MNQFIVFSWIMAHLAWIDRNRPAAEMERVIRPIAEAISAEAKTTFEVAVALELGEAETNFSYLVLTGRCSEMPKGQRCDGGRARGALSLHAEACSAAYAFPAGSPESVRAEVHCALGLMRGGTARCHSLAGGFGAYATGKSCAWRGAPDRARGVYRIERELAEMQRRGDGAGGEVAAE